MEIFSYSFMQKALLAGFFISIICPLIGTFLIFKRLAMIGDALAHVSMAGIALGLILGINPTFAALMATCSAGLAIDLLKNNFKKYEEITIAIIMSAGLGLGIILITLGGSDTASVMGYLFGSIIAISAFDLKLIIFISLIVIVVMVSLHHKLFFIAFDEEAALLNGIAINKINKVFILLTSMTVAISIKVTGVLLISALMTIPTATSLQIAKSFKQANILAIIFALLSVNSGLLLAFYLDWPPGGTIIISSLIIMLCVIMLKKTGLTRFIA